MAIDLRNRVGRLMVFVVKHKDHPDYEDCMKDLELIKAVLEEHDELDLPRDESGMVIQPKSLTRHIISGGKVKKG